MLWRLYNHQTSTNLNRRRFLSCALVPFVRAPAVRAPLMIAASSIKLISTLLWSGVDIAAWRGVDVDGNVYRVENGVMLKYTVPAHGNFTLTMLARRIAKTGSPNLI